MLTVSDATRPHGADTGSQAELEWNRMSDEEALACRDEFVQECRDHGGDVAKFAELLANASPATVRKSMAFFINNAPSRS